MKERERMRWRCRRGLLELDIVLGRFVDLHYDGLDQAQRAAFDVLLEVPDTLLWDIITGKEPPQQDAERQRDVDAVLALLRTV
jgi:antitoxin CptB